MKRVKRSMKSLEKGTESSASADVDLRDAVKRYVRASARSGTTARKAEALAASHLMEKALEKVAPTAKERKVLLEVAGENRALGTSDLTIPAYVNKDMGEYVAVSIQAVMLNAGANAKTKMGEVIDKEFKFIVNQAATFGKTKKEDVKNRMRESFKLAETDCIKVLRHVGAGDLWAAIAERLLRAVASGRTLDQICSKLRATCRQDEARNDGATWGAKLEEQLREGRELVLRQSCRKEGQYVVDADEADWEVAKMQLSQAYVHAVRGPGGPTTRLAEGDTICGKGGSGSRGSVERNRSQHLIQEAHPELYEAMAILERFKPDWADEKDANEKLAEAVGHGASESIIYKVAMGTVGKSGTGKSSARMVFLPGQEELMALAIGATINLSGDMPGTGGAKDGSGDDQSGGNGGRLKKRAVIGPKSAIKALSSGGGEEKVAGAGGGESAGFTPVVTRRQKKKAKGSKSKQSGTPGSFQALAEGPESDDDDEDGPDGSGPTLTTDDTVVVGVIVCDADAIKASLTRLTDGEVMRNYFENGVTLGESEEALDGHLRTDEAAEALEKAKAVLTLVRGEISERVSRGVGAAGARQVLRATHEVAGDVNPGGVGGRNALAGLMADVMNMADAALRESSTGQTKMFGNSACPELRDIAGGGLNHLVIIAMEEFVAERAHLRLEEAGVTAGNRQGGDGRGDPGEEEKKSGGRKEKSRKTASDDKGGDEKSPCIMCGDEACAGHGVPVENGGHIAWPNAEQCPSAKYVLGTKCKLKAETDGQEFRGFCTVCFRFCGSMMGKQGVQPSGTCKGSGRGRITAENNAVKRVQALGVPPPPGGVYSTKTGTEPGRGAPRGGGGRGRGRRSGGRGGTRGSAPTSRRADRQRGVRGGEDARDYEDESDARSSISNGSSSTNGADQNEEVRRLKKEVEKLRRSRARTKKANKALRTELESCRESSGMDSEDPSDDGSELDRVEGSRRSRKARRSTRRRGAGSRARESSSSDSQ